MHLHSKDPITSAPSLTALLSHKRNILDQTQPGLELVTADAEGSDPSKRADIAAIPSNPEEDHTSSVTEGFFTCLQGPRNLEDEALIHLARSNLTPTGDTVISDSLLLNSSLSASNKPSARPTE